jgi:hypothetical protein
MIRIFSTYYPFRALVLVMGEALMIFSSLLLGVFIRFREDSYLVLNFEYGYYKILLVTILALLLSHALDLYEPVHFGCRHYLSEHHSGKFLIAFGVDNPGPRAARLA